MNDAELDVKLRALLQTSADKAFTLDTENMMGEEKSGSKGYRLPIIKMALAAACLAVALLVAIPFLFQSDGLGCPSSIDLAITEGNTFFVNPYDKHSLYSYDTETGGLQKHSKLSGKLHKSNGSLYYIVDDDNECTIYRIEESGELSEYTKLQGSPVVIGIEEDTIFWYSKSVVDLDTDTSQTVFYQTNRLSQESSEIYAPITSHFGYAAAADGRLIIAGWGTGLISVDIQSGDVTTLYEGNSSNFYIYGDEIVFQGADTDFEDGLRTYIVSKSGENLRLLSDDELHTGATDLYGKMLYYFTEGYLDDDRTYSMRTVAMDIETGEREIIFDDMFFVQYFAGERGLFCFDPGSGGTLYYYDFQTYSLSKVIGKK